MCCINCAKAGTVPHCCQMVTGAPVWGQGSCRPLQDWHSSTELPSFPMPPTEHQQICGRHGCCNWKPENAALWYDAPLREFQEGIVKERQKERSGVVARAANHSAREPWRTLGQLSITCLTHPVAKLPRRQCMWLAHTGCHSALGNLCWTREKESSCQNGAGWSWLGKAELSRKGFSPPQDGTAVQSWQWQLCFLLG